MAANANVAAPIDAAVGANIGSIDSKAIAVAQQDAIINQDIDGAADGQLPTSSPTSNSNPSNEHESERAACRAAARSCRGVRSGGRPPASCGRRRWPTASQLIGETQGSGYREAPALARRADGQTSSSPRCCTCVLEAIDGRRGLGQIAGLRQPTGFGRPVSAENVQTLIDAQLLPLGLLRLADGSQPAVKKSNPLLGMRFRYAVTDPERTRKLTAPFAALFNP